MSKAKTEQGNLLDGRNDHLATEDPPWETDDAEQSINVPAAPARQQLEPLPQGRALTPADFIARAQEQNAPPELLDKYLALYERWREGEAKRAYANAIAAAQAEIPAIAKDREVRFETRSGGETSYRHESLAEIERTIKPILSRHGLGYRWRTKVEGDKLVVTCIVSHRDGHSEETTLFAGPDGSGSKNSIQAIGSTQTYLCRYTLKSALGLAVTEDADGRVEHENPTHNGSAPQTATRGQRPPGKPKSEVSADELKKLSDAWMEGREFPDPAAKLAAFQQFVFRATQESFDVLRPINWTKRKLDMAWRQLEGPGASE